MSSASKNLDAQDGASESPDKFTSNLPDICHGCKEGTNLQPGYDKNEAQNPIKGDIPSGTGGEPGQSLPFNNFTNTEMRLAEIEARFQQNRSGLKSNGQYLVKFRRLWKEKNLEGMPKSKLAGPYGKKVILEHIRESVPKKSWSTTLACIKEVWTYGAGLNWPILNKVDIGRLPKTAWRYTPTDKVVKEWAEATANEKDPYLRLVWLLVAQHGWRPSHATGVRWSDIKYDEQGQMIAIASDGDGGILFKTPSPVLVTLWPNVRQALEELNKECSPKMDAWILPFRDLRGKVDAKRRMSTDQFRKHWRVIQKKHRLPKLDPNELRHWVATKCGNDHEFEPARALMQGHDVKYFNPSMGAGYNKPQAEVILELQKNKFPDGPLATLMDMRIIADPGLPPEALALLRDFMTGKIGSFQLMPLLEGIKISTIQVMDKQDCL